MNLPPMESEQLRQGTAPSISRPSPGNNHVSHTPIGLQIITAMCGRTRRENATGRRRFRLEGDGAQRSDEVGPQRFTNDVGLVDTVTIGAPLEQIRELVIEPGVDGG